MDMDKLALVLEKNRYTVSRFENKEAAADYIESAINGKTVGFGDSATLASMALPARLSRRNKVRNPMPETDISRFIETAVDCLTTQVFLTSVNAVAETGELVNIDGTGNRVAGSLFGHEKVYFVIGKNKIEPTLEKAIWRARNIAAPQNAKRFGKKTPCAVMGDKCYDCSSPERICNGLVIYLKKMSITEAEIVLINEDIGM